MKHQYLKVQKNIIVLTKRLLFKLLATTVNKLFLRLLLVQSVPQHFILSPDMIYSRIFRSSTRFKFLTKHYHNDDIFDRSQ